MNILTFYPFSVRWIFRFKILVKNHLSHKKMKVKKETLSKKNKGTNKLCTQKHKLAQEWVSVLTYPKSIKFCSFAFTFPFLFYYFFNLFSTLRTYVCINVEKKRKNTKIFPQFFYFMNETGFTYSTSCFSTHFTTNRII